MRRSEPARVETNAHREVPIPHPPPSDQRPPLLPSPGREHKSLGTGAARLKRKADTFQELTPLIYTPTVGEACIRWSEIYTQPEGLYLSYSDKGNLHTVLGNWPHNVEITVMTDGSRILGLGDLGINGMGIPVGKLALYTACAGIRPDATLPLTLDLGTSNETLLKDPLYMGSRRPKVTADEEREFLDELMAALTERWPGYVPPAHREQGRLLTQHQNCDSVRRF